MKKFLSFYLIMVFPVIMFAQQTLTGTVTDENGTTLPGVNVSIKGTFVGTATNIDGNFRIQATAGDILVFQFIGYRTLEIEYTGTPTLNVTMETQVIGLDEIVVVGYGTQARSDISGAVTAISERALAEVPKVTGVQQMLQARAAGVDVVTTSNKPGGGMQIRIRGRRSFSAGNDPLYIIDGIPVTTWLNDINPNDIESINVLKDASATAIYGSRGANGVIVITTRRGKPGPVSVRLNSYVGINRVAYPPRLMDGPEFAEFKRESRRAAGRYDDNDPLADEKLFIPIELEGIALGRTTDWYGLVMEDGYVQNQDLSLSGGTEKTRYNISLGFMDETGTEPLQGYTRYSARVNLDQVVNERLSFGLSLLGTYSDRDGESFNPLFGHSAMGARNENPLAVPYDAEGNLLLRTTTEPDQLNPLLDMVPGAYVNNRNTNRLLGVLFAELELLEGLRFRTNFGPDISADKLGDYRGSRTTERQGGDDWARVWQRSNMSFTWENILTYDANIAGVHRLNFTGLHSVQDNRIENSNMSVIGLPIPTFQYHNLGAADIIENIGSGFQRSSLVSYMFRLNYVFDDRYIATFTARADGSSKFAGDNKWGYFPSAALAWNMHNEDFLSGIDNISSLRLRLSYGSIGNEGISPYSTQGLLARTSYNFGGSAAYGYRPSSIRNEGIKWETTTTFNAGLDFGLFGGRIDGSLEVYNAKTTDLLLPMVLPITSGFHSVLANVGSTRNRGIEFSLSSHIVTPKTYGGFSWSMDFNIYANREEILELAAGKVDDVGNRRFIGHPQNVFFDYEISGIWQLGEDEEAAQYGSMVGGLRVIDHNGDGRITADDRVILGNDVPDFSGGMTQRFGFRGFDLSIVAFTRMGQLIHDQLAMGFFLTGRTNHVKVDYWTPSNPTNAYPRPHNGLQTPYFVSSLRIVDGSFVKIRNINFGYTIPSNVSQKIGIQSIRAYVNIHNPFTFSEYTRNHGDDPENPTSLAPMNRTFLVGWNIQF